jgi:hypothetical protein
VAQRYDSTRRQTEFKIGELVLVRLYPPGSKVQQHSAKFVCSIDSQTFVC